MEMIEVGDVPVGFERAGDGPPLVLLHGYVSDGYTETTTNGHPCPSPSNSTPPSPARSSLYVPDAGHLCNVEAPDQFNESVRRFLREQRH